METKTRRWAHWCARLVLLAVVAAGGMQGHAQRLIDADPEALQKTFAQHKANCLFFFVEDCPVSMRDFARVQELRARYDTVNLQIVAVYVGTQGMRLQTLADSIGIPIAYAADRDHRLVAMAAARVTPEYFLFDAAGKLRYRGAIDNYAIGLAKHRRIATNHFLSDAIAALIAGRTVPTKVTKPIGCMIEPASR